MKFLSRIAAIFDRFLNILGIMAGVLLVAVLIFVNFGVVARNLLGRPQVWVDQIGEHSMVWITFLGAAWLLKKEGHIILDLVLERLKPKLRHIINALTSILCSLVCLAVFWGSFQSTWRQFIMGYKTPSVWQIPIAIVAVIIPLGSLLLFIQFLRRAHGEFLKRGLTVKARDL